MQFLNTVRTVDLASAQVHSISVGRYKYAKIRVKVDTVTTKPIYVAAYYRPDEGD